MDGLLPLSDRDLERLLQAMRASTAVTRRSQFFLWAQGPLQSLLPHECLLTAHGDFSRRALAFDVFSSVPLGDADLEVLTDPDNGLIVHAIRAWYESGEKPLVLDASTGGAGWIRRFEPGAARLGLDRLAVHATPHYPGCPASYFVFSRIPAARLAGFPAALDLLVPQLHLALVRLMASGRTESPPARSAPAIVTAREIEILQWVRDGKSNQEIGLILGISPLTVKNHVQKVLRKLQVQNRAQAVGKAISLQLIKSTDW